jgi:signal transduction histidine kinase
VAFDRALPQRPGHWWPWGIGALALALLGSTALVRLDIAARRAAFQAEARAVHRLLSQRAAQHDAMLATLVLLDSALAADPPWARLPALYPQVLQVWRRHGGSDWPAATLAQAEARSHVSTGAALAAVDAAAGHYDLVLAGSPASYALRIDIERWVARSDWPFDPDGPVRVELAQAGQRLALQAGGAGGVWRGGLTPGFVFEQVLDTASQPFELRMQRPTGPADWPWQGLATLTAGVAALAAAALALQRQRARRQRAEQLLRLARTARLNALGELAAGIAHELNQPLTAVMASTQAAQRLLADDPLPLDTLGRALAQARDQARRAADVVARLRRLLDRPGQASAAEAVSLGGAVRATLDLLQPELARLSVLPQLDDAGIRVMADPVALEQILHNLLGNALQALETVPPAQRRLWVTVGRRDGQGVLRVRDSGPGLPPEVLAHLFEPFTSTRERGLGLGLSLCESLAGAMGGTLSGQNAPGPGAEFTLALSLAPSTDR